MPFALRKAPKRDLYWVVNSETGKKHSKEPLPKAKAEAQRRALYAVESGYTLRGGMRIEQLPAGGAGGEGEFVIVGDDGERLAGPFTTRSIAEAYLRSMQTPPRAPARPRTPPRPEQQRRRGVRVRAEPLPFDARLDEDVQFRPPPLQIPPINRRLQFIQPPPARPPSPATVVEEALEDYGSDVDPSDLPFLGRDTPSPRRSKAPSPSGERKAKKPKRGGALTRDTYSMFRRQLDRLKRAETEAEQREVGFDIDNFFDTIVSEADIPKGDETYLRTVTTAEGILRRSRDLKGAVMVLKGFLDYAKDYKPVRGEGKRRADWTQTLPAKWRKFLGYDQ